MLTRGRLDLLLVSAAIFLVFFPSWRHPAVFFTVSDLVFCLGLLTILLTRGMALAPLGMLTPYWIAGLAIFLAALIGSSLINGVPMRALIVCVQYLFAFLLVPLTIMGRDREATIRLIQVFVTAAFVTSLLSIILYYSGYTGNFTFVTGNGRLGGFLDGPNTTAQVIALTCPLAAYLWLSGRMPAYWAVPLFLVLAITLVLTSSNNGLAMTGVSMTVFFLLLRNLRILGRALAGIVICATLISIWGSNWLPAIFEQRVLGALRSGSLDEAGTFEDRVALMREALDMVDDTMLVGIGVDQYREISRYGAPVHNTYLLIWTEGGLPALIAWIGLITTILLSTLLIARRQPLVAATGFAVALVFVMIGFTTGHVYARYSVVPLHLALALVLVTAQSSQRMPPYPQPIAATDPAYRDPRRHHPRPTPHLTPPAA
jgi:O-antigen ligase